MSLNWDAIFADNHLHSWPTNTLKIANHNPNPTAAGSRNIFKDDEKDILAAAEKHGFKMINKNRHSVDFMR
jgi:hypothetical protein